MLAGIRGKTREFIKAGIFTAYSASSKKPCLSPREKERCQAIWSKTFSNTKIFIVPKELLEGLAGEFSGALYVNGEDSQLVEFAQKRTEAYLNWLQIGPELAREKSIETIQKGNILLADEELTSWQKKGRLLHEFFHKFLYALEELSLWDPLSFFPRKLETEINALRSAGEVFDNAWYNLAREHSPKEILCYLVHSRVYPDISKYAKSTQNALDCIAREEPVKNLLSQLEFVTDRGWLNERLQVKLDLAERLGPQAL